MGVVYGRTLEMDRDPGLPDGQRVVVILKPPHPTPDEARAILKRQAGDWADERPELDQYVRTCRC